MTLEEAMEKHKELWLKIAEADITKYAYMEKIKRELIERDGIINDCYLCHFAIKNSAYPDFNPKTCTLCPTRTQGTCLNGMYDKVREAFIDKDTDKFKELAIEIANLPVINPIYLSEVVK